MQTATRQFADTVVISASGRIDHQSAAAFEAALAPWLSRGAAGSGGLVVDLAGVDYISSVGLRVMMIAAKAMKGQQAPLALAELQSVVAEIFTISRFDRILTIRATLDEALGFCSSAAQAQYRAEGAANSP